MRDNPAQRQPDDRYPNLQSKEEGNRPSPIFGEPMVSWETYSHLLDAYTQLLKAYSDLLAPRVRSQCECREP